MDQTSIITLLCISFVVIIVVVANKLIVRRRHSQIAKTVNEFASGLGFEVVEYEHIAGRIIGIDKKSNHLFFIQRSKDIKECIDLQHVHSCCIDEVARTVKSGKDTTRVVEKLQLVFIPVDAKKKLPQLVFFDISAGDYAMAGEHGFLERWTAAINNHLSITNKR